ncbi:MAG: hypothetical protein AB1598_01155 [Thermodesulfobacteriota bacterium]
MSLVMAMQFGDRICILSDSMISDTNTTGSDVIPGQLKTIVLNKEVSISYSGLTNKAISRIREIRADMSKRVYFDEVLESLTEFTADEKGEVAFIVSSHMGIPKLYKIADGQIHYGLDTYWIGSEEAAARVLDRFGKDDLVISELPNSMTQEEYRFREAFRNAVYEKDLPHAGGLIFDCIGTPKGYSYNNYAVVHTGDRMALDITEDYTARWAYDNHGMESYSLSLVSPKERSLAVTGAFFERSNTGFIYSPLDPCLDLKGSKALGKPKTVHPVSLSGFVNEVARYASRLETYLGG